MKSLTPDTVRALREVLAGHDRGEKHISYHVLPERLNALVAGTELANRYIRCERERMDFFRRHVDFRDRRVLDIGCNIGWFLFEALDAGARHVTGWEGKASCADFIGRAVQALGVQERFELHADYYRFDGSDPARHDVALLLNVLHHLGDDYGDGQLDMAAARAQMLEQLNGMSRRVGTLLFQIGFNWHGNRHTCLFEHGTKAEMIDFVQQGTQGHWDVEAIGVAERDAEGRVRYAPVSARNIGRQDALGEFLNRPVFVLRSRHAG